MATDYDEHLAAVLDEPAEAAQVVFPRHAGSMFWGCVVSCAGEASRGSKWG
jgi:hypothetical protein